jgi:hypothetical protein
MKKRKETYSEITPPEDLYRVKIDKDWRYGKHAMFWEIQKFDQELSNRYNEVYYNRACRGGIAYTQLGLKWAVKRKMKKMQTGYSTNYYTLKWTKIDENK